MTRFLYLVRHGEAVPHDGPLSQTGELQAQLTGRRLENVPLSSIRHGPLPRAAQTAEIIAAYFPGVPVTACELAGDYLPSDPDPAGLPPRYASFVAGFPARERTEGPERACAAIEYFTGPGDENGDQHELVVTHNLLIGWLVSQAMAAPSWRWLGLNQMNCALPEWPAAWPGRVQRRRAPDPGPALDRLPGCAAATFRLIRRGSPFPHHGPCLGRVSAR